MKQITTSKATIVLLDEVESIVNDGLIDTEKYVGLGFAKDLTEEQWKDCLDEKMCDGSTVYYPSTAEMKKAISEGVENTYSVYGIYAKFWFLNPYTAGREFIESHGFKWENCFILKLK
jgi:hypothetical protein